MTDEAPKWDPIAMASIENVFRREDGQWEVMISAIFSEEQAQMVFRRFLAEREGLIVRLENGP